ncbi:2,3-bisphosphoglycerate-independent phosphoglycerate mutase [Cardinium endosymbiont of Tipula unca]|uniref:2,3-bisphosphoglycerate-independent phosphoglycerate mutase n=1 Tax=Cardinium endosymbiont of Tipula unca TaxID=3066216 RepID=UPI0030D2C48B
MIRSKQPNPIILLILDGWGHREATDFNAIALAKKPHWDHLIQTFPHTLLNASGSSVGLPVGQMGNSEVGHLTIGAGRVLYQELTRINEAIEHGNFFNNQVFLSALKKAKETQKSVHILGLLSPGGVHSHEKHMHALLELCAQINIPNCYIHALLDGRDTPPKSARYSLVTLEEQCKKLGLGKIISLVGRYYAMDRDNRWDRTKAAYDCIVGGGVMHTASTALAGLEAAYARSETDEFVQPTCIHELGTPPIAIQSGDIVFCMNFRADRARQLSRAFLDPDFLGFKRKVWPNLGSFVSLTAYATDIPSQIAFPPPSLKNGLGEYLSKMGLKQLRMAETEKYAHVTFFFNGGIETPFPYETRLLIPSKKVASYDLVPQMSVLEITDQLLEAISTKEHNVIICNFANPDMLGHTGNQMATQEAITCIDTCIGRIASALKKQGGEVIITSDHGNAECMYDVYTQQPHTAHTTEPVPFIYVGRPAKITEQYAGTLVDIAPTLLALLDMPKPKEMTGNSLLTLI